jgi:hypothetical protein
VHHPFQINSIGIIKFFYNIAYSAKKYQVLSTFYCPTERVQVRLFWVSKKLTKWTPLGFFHAKNTFSSLFQNLYSCENLLVFEIFVDDSCLRLENFRMSKGFCLEITLKTCVSHEKTSKEPILLAFLTLKKSILSPVRWGSGQKVDSTNYQHKQNF